VLVLPFGRSCPLGDPAAAAAPGAAVAPLPGGGLFIAGGDYGDHGASSSAYWLPKGATLMREVAGGMLLRRSGATATRVGTVVVVAGGAADDRGAAHDTFEIYLPTPAMFDTSRSRKLKGGARRDHAAIEVGPDELVLVGGRADLDSAPLGSVERLDLARLTSEVLVDLTRPRLRPTLIPLGQGQLLVASGTDSGGQPIAEVERVDLDERSVETVASFPTLAYAAVAAAAAHRTVYFGCGADGRCELSLLLAEQDSFTLVPALDPEALASAGVSGFTRVGVVGLRDGRLLLAGAQSERATPRGFWVDVSASSIEPLELTRAPDVLLQLDDGALAEIDAFGLSLIRRDVLTEWSAAGDPLDPSGPAPLALDVASRFERGDGALQARVPAHAVVPHLRFDAFRAAATISGGMRIVFSGEADAAATLEITDQRVAVGTCGVGRSAGAPLHLERRGATLTVEAGAASVRCALPRALGRVGLEFAFDAGSRIAALSVERE
jgi:hypothetical protein